MKLKTLGSAVVLCFVANVFAMDSDSQKEPTLNSKKFGQSTSADQSNLENLSKEELLKEIARLKRENKDLQQQVKTHESVLAEALDQTIHTKDEKVLKEQYDQLIAAVKSGDIKKLKSLIDQGIDVDETVYGKFPVPLALAVERGNKDIAEFLLNNGADPNKSPEALIYAVKNERMDLVKLLLEKDADPNKSPKALIYAVQNGKMDLVKLLLEKGADPNVTDATGCSMLSIALKEGHAEIAKLFLSDSDHSPTLDLLYAGKYKKPMSEDDIIKVKEKLAHFKFKLYDTPDYSGMTPLMHAISSEKISDKDRIEIVRLLLKNKIKLNHVNLKGDIALKLARRLQRDEIVKLLLEEAEKRGIQYTNDDDRRWIQELKNKHLKPVDRLLAFCLDKRNIYSASDLQMDYAENNNRFIGIMKVKGKEYKTPDDYPSRKEARDAISELVFNELASKFLREGGSCKVLQEENSATDNSSPIRKLREYLQNESIKYDPLGVVYIRYE